ncbi:hypothetical protein [Amycolatopsis sp. H20-H5]|uniref:hypothetical protein n=1 Tax=Amycolatopsis sp. H20-H5 TaxID=3046309 RepID=UPI002DBBEDEC|nr:hypothetical protein [Amycolatopsis sp. H20-H5]MEC3979769.1 hypothetical protein [Amycolatopsis sp. H20-H5]
MQVVTPFATKVLTGEGAFQARFAFYALVQATASLLFLLMLREIRRHHLYRDDTPPDLFANSTMQVMIMAATFLLSIPVSFFTGYAYACWIFFPIATSLASRIRRRRASAERG